MHVHCALCMKKGLCKVTGEKNWPTWKPRMATLTRKRKYEEVHWSLSRSSLAVCCTQVSLLFAFPLLVISVLLISQHSSNSGCYFVSSVCRDVSIVHPECPWTKDASERRNFLRLDASGHLIFCAQTHACRRMRTHANERTWTNADACKIFQLHSLSNLENLNNN